jgi:hypothetical protein
VLVLEVRWSVVIEFVRKSTTPLPMDAERSDGFRLESTEEKVNRAVSADRVAATIADRVGCCDVLADWLAMPKPAPTNPATAARPSSAQGTTRLMASFCHAWFGAEPNGVAALIVRKAPDAP